LLYNNNIKIIRLNTSLLSYVLEGTGLNKEDSNSSIEVDNFFLCKDFRKNRFCFHELIVAEN